MIEVEKIATATAKLATSEVGRATQKSLLDFSNIIGLSAADPRLVIARLIRVALSFLGILFLLLMLQSGFTMMLSGGDEEKVAKAKKIFFNAIIGLIIILSSYSIASGVINAFTTAIQP